MKKRILPFLSLALMAALLVACASTGASSAVSTSVPLPGEEETPAPSAVQSVETPAPSASAIEDTPFGSWSVAQVSYSGTTLTLDELDALAVADEGYADMAALRLAFDENGTGEIRYERDTSRLSGPFTWRLVSRGQYTATMDKDADVSSRSTSNTGSSSRGGQSGATTFPLSYSAEDDQLILELDDAVYTLQRA